MTGSGICIELIEAESTLRGKGVTGGAINAEQGDDVAGTAIVDLLHLVGMHPHQASDLDLFAGAAVVDGIAFLQDTLISPHVGQLSVASVFELEGQHDKFIVRIVGDREFLSRHWPDQGRG